jgi:hypothetical protein
MGLYIYGSIKKIKIRYMNVQFELIKGFLLGIDYLEDIEQEDVHGVITFDLLRISLGIFFIHIMLNARDSQ